MEARTQKNSARRLPEWSLAHCTARPSSKRRGFTLIELMVVIGIIVLLAAITVPAVKSLLKNNDQSQATNLVRSLITTARSIALSEHRQAGVVFFEETPAYSSPANTSQTAMQLFVEQYNQPLSGQMQVTFYTQYTTARQYLPSGIKLATLGGTGGVNLAENTDTTNAAVQTRAIIFDANGQLLVRSGLESISHAIGFANHSPGSYPWAQNDWNFTGNGINANTAASPISSPGFVIYNKTDFDSAGLSSDTARVNWLLQHSDVILVNSNTGTVLQ